MIKTLFTVALSSLLLISTTHAQESSPQVIATTTIAADVVQQVVGDLYTVGALVPVNSDTHAFEPTATDAVRIAEADLIFAIGAGYEGFLDTLIANIGRDVPVTILSNGVEIISFDDDAHAHTEEDHDHEEDAEATEEAEDAHHHDHTHFGRLGEEVTCDDHSHEDHDDHEEEGHDHAHGVCDPHVWTDPNNVIIWVGNIVTALSELDPAHADVYEANGARYIESLSALDAEIRARVEMLPEEQRVLVTNHEFLGYFAHAYGFDVIATVLPGISTNAELDAQSLAELVTLVRDAQVPAIFTEVSSNSRLAQVLAQEAGISTIPALYTESLSDTDGDAPTYIEYMRFNTETIVSALMGE